jgi:hypothetical protein
MVWYIQYVTDLLLLYIKDYDSWYGIAPLCLAGPKFHRRLYWPYFGFVHCAPMMMIHPVINLINNVCMLLRGTKYSAYTLLYTLLVHSS